MTTLQTVTPTQANKETPFGENFETVSAAGIYGRRQPAESGLTWAFYGGLYNGNTIANGTVTLTNTSDNYVVVLRSTGVVSTSTSSANSVNPLYAKLYQVTCAGGVVTTVVDQRWDANGLMLSGGGSSVAANVPATRYTIELLNTTDSDPGAGLLKFNNATPASATFLYIDDSTSDGVDLSTYFLGLGASGYITIQSVADAGEWAIFKWTAITDGTGYFKFAVTAYASLGTLDDADAVLVAFDSDANSGAAAYANAYDIRAFGTLANNGSTDDSAVFIAAAASGARVIHAENLNCAILSQVSIPSNQIWVLSGSKLTMTSTTTAMFKANLVDDWAMVGPFTIVGAGSSVGTAKGVWVVGSNRWKIDHYTSRTINGWGVLIDDGAESGTLRGDQGYMHNFRAESCYVGYEDTAGSAAEYSTLVAPMITGCGTGLRTAAGNTLVVGGQIIDNTGNGVELKNGTNHGHGAFMGTNINHNATYNVFADQVTNGHDFIGCHIYGTPGTINLDRSKGIHFHGGHLDCSVASVSGGSSGRNIFRDVYCPGTSIAVSGTGVPELSFIDCWGPGADDGGTPSVPINDPSTCYVHVERAAASTQSITAATATDLIWNTEAFDRNGAYNSTTGVFTVPVGETGNYRFMGNIMITGVSLTTSSFVEMLIDGASSHLLTGAFYIAQRLVFNFCFDRYLQAGQAVKFQATIGGSSITHGGTSWKSTMSIQRIQ